MALVLKSTVRVFGGSLMRYSHQSVSTKTEMNFAVFDPRSDRLTAKIPALYWLSGLTCTEENFITKAGAFRKAAEKQLLLVCPDTSPRGTDIEGEHKDWDFGSGAGFYVNATQPLWKNHYNMYDYVVQELPGIVSENFNTNGKQSIFGHSMGGHGALICYLKNAGMYESVSAFAPICNPINCPWGQKAFTGYLGPNVDDWKAYDATELLAEYKGAKTPILIDQGTEDGFLTKKQLLPEVFEAAAAKFGVPVTLRMQAGYDHSYYFISTFVDDHLEHHAAHLNA